MGGIKLHLHFAKLSHKGLHFLEHLGRDASHDVLHWAGGIGGATIGPFYDLATRTRESVERDLAAIGVPPSVAAKIAAGAGLKGVKAQLFVSAHKGLLRFGREEGKLLLKRTVGDYEQIVKKFIKVDLEQHVFDALTAFAAVPGGNFIVLAGFINAHKIEHAVKHVLTHGLSAIGHLFHHHHRHKVAKLLEHGHYQ